MAQQLLADEVTEAVTWLVHHEGAAGLSYVFKINKVFFDQRNLNLTWRDYDKQPGDNDIRNLANGVQTALDVQNQDEIQTPIPEDNKRSVCLLLGLVKKCLFELFKCKQIAPEDIAWFLQAEWSRDQEFHVHVILWGEPVKQIHGKWWQKYLCSCWSRWLVACLRPLMTTTDRVQLRGIIEKESWVDVLQYKHSSTRKEYCKLVTVSEIIANYFLMKDPWWQEKHSIYYCSFDSSFKTDILSFSQRLATAKLYRQQQENRRQPDSENSSSIITTNAKEAKRARIETTKERTVKETVQLLYNARIISPEEWALFDPDSYVHMMTQPNGESLIKNTLDIVTLKMSKERTAFDLIKEKADADIDDPSDTRVWQIFILNGMNPMKCIHAIMCCLNRQMGKRNTILFHGPATTGKSLLAQSLCDSIKNVGCYNPANINFPFNDCTNKNVIWVEEASNFGQQVNQFKAICSGQTIRIDQKGKGSKSIAPTPVIMTTNENITEVRIGCESKPEHTQPIKDRMLAFHLTHLLPGDFGLIHITEWPRLFAWMVSMSHEPYLARYVKKWGAPPTWGEAWNEPALTKPASYSTSSSDSFGGPEFEDLLQAWETDEAAQPDLSLQDIDLLLQDNTPAE